MNYLNTPLIRLQVLIDAPTLFVTLLKEIFGILVDLIIFNVFEYLKLQLLKHLLAIRSDCCVSSEE